MKTLVVCKHAACRATNGDDGCFARVGDGLCPGVKIAEWLNGLGEDEDQYIDWPSGAKRETNGNVRDSWLKNNSHIVAREPYLAKLKAEERRLQAELRAVRKRLASCGAVARKELVSRLRVKDDHA